MVLEFGPCLNFFYDGEVWSDDLIPNSNLMGLAYGCCVMIGGISEGDPCRPTAKHEATGAKKNMCVGLEDHAKAKDGVRNKGQLGHAGLV